MSFEARRFEVEHGADDDRMDSTERLVAGSLVSPRVEVGSRIFGRPIDGQREAVNDEAATGEEAVDKAGQGLGVDYLVEWTDQVGASIHRRIRESLGRIV